MSSALRQQAVEIYSQGLAHITPEFLLREALSISGDTLELTFLEGSHTVALPPGESIVLLAVGKAAAPMAQEAAQLLQGRIAEGLVVTKEGFSLPGLPFPVHETAHPVPDERGIQAAGAVEAMLQRAGAEHLALVLVSGGASALLPAPLEGITLSEKQALAGLMLRTEMDIHQINRVRKTVSRFKGGGLAALAAPASVVGMYLSDVPGDDLASIGSGPTVPEAVDAPAAVALLKDRGIWSQTPPAIRQALEHGIWGQTPAAIRQILEEVEGQGGGGRRPLAAPATPPLNGLIGTNRHLLHAMADAARRAGYVTQVEEAPTTGLNATALPRLLARWEGFARGHRGEPQCLISGGETLVKVTGKGSGGRCQELAALAMPRLDAETVFLAAGSDGNDGPTDAAGGVVDAQSWEKVQANAIPYGQMLYDNDSYHLLELSGNLIKVPPTRNNVMDVHMFLRAG